MTNPNLPLGKHQQAVLDLIRKLGPWSLHGRPWDYGSRTARETAGLLDTLVKRGLVTIIDVDGRSTYRAILQPEQSDHLKKKVKPLDELLREAPWSETLNNPQEN